MSEVKTVKVWVLKYWETSGVSIVECERVTSGNGDVWYKTIGSCWNSYHHHGHDYALSAEEAESAIRVLAERKRASLQKRLDGIRRKEAKAINTAWGRS